MCGGVFDHGGGEASGPGAAGFAEGAGAVAGGDAVAGAGGAAVADVAESAGGAAVSAEIECPRCHRLDFGFGDAGGRVFCVGVWCFESLGFVLITSLMYLAE